MAVGPYEPRTAGAPLVAAVYGNVPNGPALAPGHPLLEAIRAQLVGRGLSPQEQLLRQMYPEDPFVGGKPG